MKRFLLAGAVALSAGQALAADLPPAPAPRAPAAYVPTTAVVYNWSGFYIGANGGYAFANGDATYTATTPFLTGGTLASGDLNGGFVGGQAGFNWQTGALVLGIEGDWQWAWQETNNGTGTACGTTFTCTANHKVNWFGTARGRIGGAFDRVLLYATGGGAWMNVTSQFNVGTASVFDQSSTLGGWTAGAGVEVAFSENFSAKLEYLYISVSDFTASGTIPVPAGGTLTETTTITNNVIRAGLNFRFPVR
jgi:outer membrane immunogenic protein